VVESLLAEYLIKERQPRAAQEKVIESTVALWSRLLTSTRRSPTIIRRSRAVKLLADYRRRVVVPLVDKSSIGKVTNPRLNPTFRIKGPVPHPLEIVSVAKGSLGEFVQCLEEQGDAIIAALDEMLSR
jgi:hypothetical protein